MSILNYLSENILNEKKYMVDASGNKIEPTQEVKTERGDKPVRGDWGQRMRLREMRRNKYIEIKKWVDENRPYEEIDSKYPIVVYEMRKLELVKGLEMPESVRSKIMSDIERVIEDVSAGLDKDKIQRLYDETRDVDVTKMKQDDFVSDVVEKSVRNKEYRDLMVSLGYYTNDSRSVSDEGQRQYITSKYSDILNGELGEKVEELMDMDVSDAGDRREGIRVPGTSKYMEDMSDEEIWKVYLIANKYRERMSTFKPHEMWAWKYINEHQPPLPMPFGKYKDLGWSAQDVIKKDKKYSEWLTGKIMKKDSKNRSPFEKWFMEEYANEYLL